MDESGRDMMRQKSIIGTEQVNMKINCLAFSLVCSIACCEPRCLLWACTLKFCRLRDMALSTVIYWPSDKKYAV